MVATIGVSVRRVASGGPILVPANSTPPLGSPFTRNTGERLMLCAWVDGDSGDPASPVLVGFQATLAPLSGNIIQFFLQRETSGGLMQVRCNVGDGATLSVSWAVFGFTP